MRRRCSGSWHWWKFGFLMKCLGRAVRPRPAGTATWSRDFVGHGEISNRTTRSCDEIGDLANRETYSYAWSAPHALNSARTRLTHAIGHSFLPTTRRTACPVTTRSLPIATPKTSRSPRRCNRWCKSSASLVPAAGFARVSRRPSLSAMPHLWPSIETALGQSRYLILLASLRLPATLDCQGGRILARAYKSPDRLFIGLTDGELAWDGAAN